MCGALKAVWDDVRANTPVLLILLALTIGAIAASHFAPDLWQRVLTILLLIAFIGGIGCLFAYRGLRKAAAQSEAALKREKARVKYVAEILSLFGTLGAVATIALYATSADQALRDVASAATAGHASGGGSASAGILKDLHSLAIAMIVLAFASAAAGRKVALAHYERFNPESAKPQSRQGDGQPSGADSSVV